MDAKEHFQAVDSDAKVDPWMEYLTLQAELFAPHEFDLFVRLGLNKNLTPLLDVGGGPGVYARKLRALSPTTEVLAVDGNPRLLERFEESLRDCPDPMLSCARWSVGESPPPADVSECKAAVIRYVLQHVHDPVAFMKEVGRALGRGSLMFIVEEEDGLYQMWPDIPALRTTIEIWQDWAAAFGGKREMGRTVPSVIHEAGLKVESVRVLCHTSSVVGFKPLVRYFALSLDILANTTPEVLSRERADELLEELAKVSKAEPEAQFLFYPQVVTVAKVP